MDRDPLCTHLHGKGKSHCWAVPLIVKRPTFSCGKFFDNKTENDLLLSRSCSINKNRNACVTAFIHWQHWILLQLIEFGWWPPLSIRWRFRCYISAVVDFLLPKMGWILVHRSELSRKSTHPDMCMHSPLVRTCKLAGTDVNVCLRELLKQELVHCHLERERGQEGEGFSLKMLN